VDATGAVAGVAQVPHDVFSYTGRQQSMADLIQLARSTEES
jgi:hypothetical protein